MDNKNKKPMQDLHPPLQPNEIYHVINHANGFENIFSNSGNYQYFLQKYATYIYPIAQTYAYCLMPNHFHLLIRIRSEVALEERFMELKEEGNKSLQDFQNLEELGEEVPKMLSQQFSNFFNGYTKAFNKQQNRKGALFTPRFKRKQISDEAYFLTCLRYIHQNPVRHGLVKNMLDWPHSSIHAYYWSNRPSSLDRDAVLEWFGSKHTARQKEFWAFHELGWDLNDLDLEV